MTPPLRSPLDRIELRREEFESLREMFTERFGLAITPDARTSMERRLQDRLIHHGYGTFAEYIQFLRFSGSAVDEWEELADVLTVHETYFWRDESQLRSVRDEVLPLLAEQGQGRRRRLANKKAPGIGSLFWRGIKLAGRFGRRSSGAGSAAAVIRLPRRRLYGPTGARCGSVVQIRVAFGSL